MKRIEDAPKELQDMFATIFDEWWNELCPNYGTTWMYDHRREVFEHYFLKGFDTAMATGGWAPANFKRTVSRIMNIDGQIYVTSSDGKVFVLQGRPEQWRPLPGLPQD